jgi:hypothetical protein
MGKRIAEMEEDEETKVALVMEENEDKTDQGEGRVLPFHLCCSLFHNSEIFERLQMSLTFALEVCLQ